MTIFTTLADALLANVRTAPIPVPEHRHQSFVDGFKARREALTTEMHRPA